MSSARRLVRAAALLWGKKERSPAAGLLKLLQKVEVTPDVVRGFAEPRTRRRRLWTKLRPQSTVKILSKAAVIAFHSSASFFGPVY